MSIITVSRSPLSGGKALAEAVASVIEAPCVGREIVVEAASKLGVSEEVLNRKLQKAPGLWERLTSERRTYVIAVQAALAQAASKGNLVYHGHDGHLLLRGLPGVLRVCLVAPMPLRIQIAMERFGMDREAAEARVHYVDSDRARWLKFIYGVDWRDPAHYDLVMNLQEMSIETACALVVEAARRPEFAVTESVREKLADFALATRVKAALAMHPASRSLDLEVGAKNGVVKLEGTIPEATMLAGFSARWEHELRDIAEDVEGVREVVLEVRGLSALEGRR